MCTVVVVEEAVVDSERTVKSQRSELRNKNWHRWIRCEDDIVKIWPRPKRKKIWRRRAAVRWTELEARLGDMLYRYKYIGTR